MIVERAVECKGFSFYCDDTEEFGLHGTEVHTWLTNQPAVMWKSARKCVGLALQTVAREQTPCNMQINCGNSRILLHLFWRSSVRCECNVIQCNQRDFCVGVCWEHWRLLMSLIRFIQIESFLFFSVPLLRQTNTNAILFNSCTHCLHLWTALRLHPCVFVKRCVRWWWRGCCLSRQSKKPFERRPINFWNGNDKTRLIIQVSIVHRSNICSISTSWENGGDREGSQSHETFRWNRKVLSLASKAIFHVWHWTCVLVRLPLIPFWWHINCWVRSCSWPVAKHKNEYGPEIKWCPFKW